MKKSGLSKGKKVGQKEEQRKIAKNLLKLGIDPEDIKKATGLTRRRNRKTQKRNNNLKIIAKQT